MKKKNLFLLMILGLLIFGTMTACSPPEASPPPVAPSVEVGGVPEELTHWLHSQLGLMKNPIIISQKHEDHIYILVTMGSKSRDQGQLAIAEESSSNGAFIIELTYRYPEGATDSLDTHFMIFKAPAQAKIQMSLMDEVTKNDLAGFSHR
jgi:hypothetical protein